METQERRWMSSVVRECDARVNVAQSEVEHRMARNSHSSRGI